MTSSAIRPQLARVIANALWRNLKRGLWYRTIWTRDMQRHAPRPAPERRNASAVAKAPSASTVVIMRCEEWTGAVLYRQDWRKLPCPMCDGSGCDFCTDGVADFHFAVRLPRKAYEEFVEALPAVERFALLRAYASPAIDAPFRYTPNRHGAPKLRRNDTDPVISAEVATALERIAALAEVRDETTWEDALITDDDVPDPTLSTPPDPVQHAHSC